MEVAGNGSGNGNGNGNGRLTGKQQAFVLEYVKDFNATQAAIRAGYQGGYFGCAVIAMRNLKKPKIEAAISELVADRAMDADECLYRLGDQARATMADFVDITGSATWTVNLEKAQKRGKLHLIERLRPGPGGNGVDVQLYNAQIALLNIGKAHGLFIDRKRLEGEVTITDKTEDERQRLLAEIESGVGKVDTRTEDHVSPAGELESGRIP